jgi:hypothetical protein
MYVPFDETDQETITVNHLGDGIFVNENLDSDMSKLIGSNKSNSNHLSNSNKNALSKKKKVLNNENEKTREKMMEIRKKMNENKKNKTNNNNNNCRRKSAGQKSKEQMDTQETQLTESNNKTETSTETNNTTNLNNNFKMKRYQSINESKLINTDILPKIANKNSISCNQVEKPKLNAQDNSGSMNNNQIINTSAKVINS